MEIAPNFTREQTKPSVCVSGQKKLGNDPNECNFFCFFQYKFHGLHPHSLLHKLISCVLSQFKVAFPSFDLRFIEEIVIQLIEMNEQSTTIWASRPMLSIVLEPVLHAVIFKLFSFVAIFIWICSTLIPFRFDLIAIGSFSLKSDSQSTWTTC